MKYIEDKMPDITNLGNTATTNAKIDEVKVQVPNITNLATTATYTNVDNKILDHSKYITTKEFNNLAAKTFTARLKQANSATKDYIADFVKKIELDDKPKEY